MCHQHMNPEPNDPIKTVLIAVVIIIALLFISGCASYQETLQTLSESERFYTQEQYDLIYFINE